MSNQTPVTLRPLVEQDLPTRAVWTADPELARLMRAKDTGAINPDTQLEENRTWFANRIASGAELYAIDLGEICVGDIDLTVDSAGVAELTLFIGDRSAWGKGVGTRTMEMLLASLKARGDVRKVVVDVAPGNERALTFWQKTGFTQERTEKDGTVYLVREV